MLFIAADVRFDGVTNGTAFAHAKVFRVMTTLATVPYHQDGTVDVNLRVPLW